MATTEFKLERVGEKARAQVGPEFEEAFGQVIGIARTDQSQPLFQDSMDWLLRHKDGLQESGSKLAGFQSHFVYYLKNMAERKIDPVAVWSRQGTAVKADDMEFLKRYLPEFLNHITSGVLAWKSEAVAKPDIFRLLQERCAVQSSDRLRQKVPYAVLGLPSEANLVPLFEHFEKSIDVAGDICEFGCFRGATSIKMAFMVKALGQSKTCYAFDTFEGFQINDPGGGALGIGSYKETNDAFDELTKWGNVLPLKAVKGDATKTCKIIANPLSFVWLDLDMGVLMDPVLDHIWPYIGRDTVVGIDDVGRPETPTVAPWVDEVIASGRLTKVAYYPNEFIGIYRRS